VNVILASASPRRRALLEMLHVKNLIVRPAAGEELPHPELAPDALVRELSRCKAAEVAAACAGPDDVVVGADTVVVLDGAVLGKPRDTDDARRMLSALSARTHTVYTGLTVIRGTRLLSHAERTDVRFRALAPEEIDAYVATGEPMDKAGAYGIQGFGCRLVKRIEGDYFTVMGLPIAEVTRCIEKIRASENKG
jgi:septum formation protein